MLPPTSPFCPAASSIRPINVVVVDFPFVPVIAMRRPVIQRDANSSSPIVSTPFARAASNAACSVGTPGLVTIRSAPASVSARCPPSSNSMPCALKRSAASNVSRVSVSITRAPRRSASSAAAMPLRAAPTTTTRRPRTENPVASTPSPQLQRRQAEQRKDDSHDQKARDHLRLAPSDQLEVMVDRGHLEHALTCELEGSNLDDDGQRFDDEHAADDGEQQLLLDQDSDGAERSAERERSNVSHEDVGGVRVVPKEPETGADQRSAEDGQLTGRLEPHEQQILREHRVPCDIGKGSECRSGDRERADGEPIETVGKVHRVAGADEHENCEQDVERAEIRNQVLEERKDQTRV